MTNETRLTVYRGNSLVGVQSAYELLSERTRQQLGNGGFLSIEAAAELQSVLEQQGLSLSDPRERESLVELVKLEARQIRKRAKKEDNYSDPELQKISNYLETARERIRQNLYDLEAELPVGFDLRIGDGSTKEVTKKPFLSVKCYGPIHFFTKFQEETGGLKLLGDTNRLFEFIWYVDFDKAFDRIKKGYLGKVLNEKVISWYSSMFSFYLNIKTHIEAALELKERKKKVEEIKKRNQLEQPLKSLQELLMEEHNPTKDF